MLHNTGPYPGHSEVPGNMGAPINMSHINPPVNMSLPMNMTHMNNMSKINPLNHTQTRTALYGAPEHPSLHAPLNMSSTVNPFVSYSSQRSHYPYTNLSPTMMRDTNLHHPLNLHNMQNGMLPMNLNVYNDHSNYNIMNSLMDAHSRLSAPTSVPEPDYVRKSSPLNIPHISARPLTKLFESKNDAKTSLKPPELLPPVDTDYSHHNYKYDMVEENSNLDLSMKSLTNAYPTLAHNYNTERKTSAKAKSIDYYEPELPQPLKNHNTIPILNQPENLNVNSAENVDITLSSVFKSNLKTRFTDPSLEVNIKEENDRLWPETATDCTEQPDLVSSQFNSDPTPSKITPKSKSIDSTLKEEVQRPTVITQDNPMKEIPAAHETTSKPAPTTCEVLPEPDLIMPVIKTEVDMVVMDTDYVSPFVSDSHGFMKHGFQPAGFTITEAFESYNVALSIVKNDESQNNKANLLFECPHCSLLFHHPKRFLVHYKWHSFGQTNEKRRQIADAKEMRKLERKRLSLTKYENGEFPCNHCDQVCETKRQLKNHRAKHHSGQPKECRLCHKIFANVNTLRNHLRATHTEEKKFTCDECPKTFKFMHSLQRHQATHLEKIYGCKECEKKFGSELLLHIHAKTHDKLQKGTTYHCSYCGKGFYASYNLQVHERTHRNERPFVCHICHSTYGTNSSLQRHLKVSHSDSKPFECTVCHRSFTTEHIRDRHEMRIHADPESLKFPCAQCTSRYLSATDLSNHVKKVHRKGRKRRRKASTTDSD